MKWLEALTYLQRIEDNEAGFWSRNSDQTITIFVKGAHGNDPRQWHNARQIEDLFGGMVKDGITPDPMSGHLIIRLRPFKITKEERNQLIKESEYK